MGGGGSSGGIDYPEHMIGWHSDMLTMVGLDIATTKGGNPYSSVLSYDPSAELQGMYDATGDFESAIDAQSFDHTKWIDAFSAALAIIPTASSLSANIATEVAAFTDEHDAERNDVILPRFKAGMTDVNAVMTSAFVVGQSIIEAYGARDVTRFDSDLTQKAFLQEEKLAVERSRMATVAGSDAMVTIGLELTAEQALMANKLKTRGVAIDARRTSDESALEISKANAIWTLETYQYGNNVLAAISGGSAPAVSSGPTKTQAAAGGALAGAAAGAQMTGNPYGVAIGAVVGAVVGGVGGYLSV